jgi:hypothetical protein
MELCPSNSCSVFALLHSCYVAMGLHVTLYCNVCLLDRGRGTLDYTLRKIIVKIKARVLSYLKTETIHSPKRHVLKDKQDDMLDEDKTMDNVQKRNICTNVPTILKWILER